MSKTLTGALVLILASSPSAQGPSATDVTAADIAAFVDALPRNRVSDRPMRVVDGGGYRVGLYTVFRPEAFPDGANLHRVATTEIYYMLEGAATLVTGGVLTDETESPNNPTSLTGPGIEGG